MITMMYLLIGIVLFIFIWRIQSEEARARELTDLEERPLPHIALVTLAIPAWPIWLAAYTLYHFYKWVLK